MNIFLSIILYSLAGWLEHELVGNREDRFLPLQPKYGLRRENLSSGFLTKQDSNQSDQLQRLARKLKFSS